MSDCTKITADILKNCHDPLLASISDVIYLINQDEIDYALSTINGSNPLILEDLILKSSSPSYTAFQLEGQNFSNDHDNALVKGKYMDGFDHNLMFRIFDNDPDVKLWIKNALGSRFVVIVKNKYDNKNKITTPSDSVYEVLGWEFGLRISEITQNKSDVETKGAWIFKATCDDVNKEPNPPMTLYKTDLTTTEAIITALL